DQRSRGLRDQRQDAEPAEGGGVLREEHGHARTARVLQRFAVRSLSDADRLSRLPRRRRAESALRMGHLADTESRVHLCDADGEGDAYRGREVREAVGELEVA